MCGVEICCHSALVRILHPRIASNPSHAAREHRQNVPGTLRRFEKPGIDGAKDFASGRDLGPSRSHLGHEKHHRLSGEYLRKAAACQIHHFDNVNVTCVLCRSMGLWDDNGLLRSRRSSAAFAAAAQDAI